MAARLARAGFVAAEEEAAELLDATATGAAPLEDLVARRLAGEPLAWVVGHALFDDFELRVAPGVYVPRQQTVELARRAAVKLAATGTAVDLCTGSGAVGLALQRARPQSRVLATDIDARAVACARRNGVDALHGDLFDPLPPGLAGAVDVVTAVVPYVPTPALVLLPRDTLTFESRAHYDGGPDGTDCLRRVLVGAVGFLRPGGAVCLELGAGQPALLGAQLQDLGYVQVETWADEDGDVRGLRAARPD